MGMTMIMYREMLVVGVGNIVCGGGRGGGGGGGCGGGGGGGGGGERWWFCTDLPEVKDLDLDLEDSVCEDM